MQRLTPPALPPPTSPTQQQQKSSGEMLCSISGPDWWRHVWRGCQTTLRKSCTRIFGTWRDPSILDTNVCVCGGGGGLNITIEI